MYNGNQSSAKSAILLTTFVVIVTDEQPAKVDRRISD